MSKITSFKNKSFRRLILLFHVCDFFTHHTLIPTYTLFTREFTVLNTFPTNALFTSGFYEYYNYFHNQL